MKVGELRALMSDLADDAEVLFEVPGWNVNGCEYNDLVHGTMRKVDFKRGPCPHCAGTGNVIVDGAGDKFECSHCHGAAENTTFAVVRHHILDRTSPSAITLRPGNLRLRGYFNKK